MAVNLKPEECVDLCPPIRNRYFYGKLLDVFHFELEQEYFNHKRWLLNRLVSGYGVVCGLGVQLGPDNQSVIVLPGVAIDKCGREIIVCQKSEPIPLPLPPPPPTSQTNPQQPNPNQPTSVPGGTPAGAVNPANTPGTTPTTPGTVNTPTPKDNCDCGPYVHLNICYHECQTDPVPALGGDCDTQAVCSPGAIRERYRLSLCDGKLTPARTTTRIPDLLSGGAFNYRALSDYVTNACAPCADDCCIPLANIKIPDPGGTYDQTSIHTEVRPIVYSNDVLYEIILALVQPQNKGGK
jgi:hypothetical protein